MYYCGLDFATKGSMAQIGSEGPSGGSSEGLVRLYEWKPMRRRSGTVIRLVERVSGSVHEFNTLAEMGAHIAQDMEAPSRMVVEDQHVSPRNVRTGLRLARGCGLVLSHILVRQIGEGVPASDVAQFLNPSAWRRAYWGPSKRLSRDEWKQRAIVEAHKLTGLKLGDDSSEAVLMAIVCQKLV